MKKINILQLVTGLGMGGAEKVVYDLAFNSDKSKFNTYVIALSKRVERVQEFIDAKIDTTVLHKDNTLSNLFSMIKEINLFIKEKEIDVIHAHMSHPMIIATILKILNPKVRIVTTSHNIDIESKVREIFLYIFKI